MVYASSLSYLSSSSSKSNINTNTNKKTMELSPYFISSQLIPLIQIVDPISQSGVTIFEDSSPTDITTIPTETDTTTSRTSSSSRSSSSSSSRTTCTTTRTIVVAFRGSATPINFSTNLKFRLVPIDDELLSMSSLSTTTATGSNYTSNNSDDDDDDDDDNDYKIHEGFQDASIGLWKLVQPKLLDIINNNDVLLSSSSSSSASSSSSYQKKEDTTKIRLIFTGHSLGGATAQLCAIQYYNYQQKLKQQQQQGITSSNSVDTVQVQVLPPLSGIITFGGPRIVNNELANYWNKQLLLYNHDTAACTSSSNDNDNININNSMNIIIRNYIHLKDTIIKQNGPLWDQLGFGRIGEDIICEYNQPIVYNNNNNNNNNNHNNDDDDDDLPLPVVAWNILDHCQYLGIYVGPRLF